jgi:hypothetical protein
MFNCQIDTGVGYFDLVDRTGRLVLEKICPKTSHFLQVDSSSRDVSDAKKNVILK